MINVIKNADHQVRIDICTNIKNNTSRKLYNKVWTNIQRTTTVNIGDNVWNNIFLEVEIFKHNQTEAQLQKALELL